MSLLPQTKSLNLTVNKETVTPYYGTEKVISTLELHRPFELKVISLDGCKWRVCVCVCVYVCVCMCMCMCMLYVRVRVCKWRAWRVCVCVSGARVRCDVIWL